MSTDKRKQHRSFWDCYELETYSMEAEIIDPDGSTAERLEIFSCDECGALFACQHWDEETEQHPEFNWFGFKETATLDSILDSYS